MYVTMEYLAKVTNVSKATISRVINNKPGVSKGTRERILGEIQKYGYEININNQIKNMRRTRVIGVVVPEISNPFFTQVITAIESYIDTYDYQMIFAYSSQAIEKEKQLIATMIGFNVDGIILASAANREADTLELIRKYKVPTVLLDRSTAKDDHMVGVFADNEYSVFMAVDKLIKIDNGQPLLILGPAGVSTTEERRVGYEEALKYNGIECDTSYILSGDYTYQSGYDAVMKAMNMGVRFKSIMACNDMMALGAIMALKNLGIHIPEDVDVIGFDNIQLGELIEPRLTTVSQPLEALGREAARTLIRMINGERVQEHSIRLDVQLIERGSTKRLKVGRNTNVNSQP